MKSSSEGVRSQKALAFCGQSTDHITESFPTTSRMHFVASPPCFWICRLHFCGFRYSSEIPPPSHSSVFGFFACLQTSNFYEPFLSPHISTSNSKYWISMGAAETYPPQMWGIIHSSEWMSLSLTVNPPSNSCVQEPWTQSLYMGLYL